MTLVVIAAIAAILFLLAFVTKRRFGVLGLGLAAGVLLSQNATRYVGDFLEQNDLAIGPLSYVVTAAVLLTLLPALLLLLGGPTYVQRRNAILGAAGFALLGTLLILGPLTTALPTLDDGVRQALDFTARWQALIVAAAIIIAVGDTIVLHGGRGLSRKRAKH